MAYNPGNLDLIGSALKGAQLALTLENLGKLRKERETSEQETAIASASKATTPMLSPVGDMKVNMGNKEVFDPEQYITGLETSGNPALLEKAQSYRKSFADIASTRETTRQNKIKNDLEESLNSLTTMQTALDLADDDPESAARFFTQSNIDMGDDKESAQQITPLGNNKYEFIGTDSQGKPIRQVIDRARLVETRADANTRYTQMMESQRNRERIAKEKDTSGGDYLDATAPDTGKPIRKKISEMLSEFKVTHPTSTADDLEAATISMQANLPGATQEMKDKAKAMEAEKGNALAKFAEWSWNTYQADPLGLISSKEPKPWMGASLPPPSMMRGKAIYNNKTRKWKVSNGTEWIDPSDEQMKKIKSQMPK